MISYTLPDDLEIVRIMAGVMPADTVVVFYPPTTEAQTPMPPRDYAANPEPWESVA